MLKRKLQEWYGALQALFEERAADEFVEPTEIFYIK